MKTYEKFYAKVPKVALLLIDEKAVASLFDDDVDQEIKTKMFESLVKENPTTRQPDTWSLQPNNYEKKKFSVLRANNS